MQIAGVDTHIVWCKARHLQLNFDFALLLNRQCLPLGLRPASPINALTLWSLIPLPQILGTRWG